MTCHNRREKTLTCLEALRRQREHSATVDAYVVDDGSTDGTAEVVAALFPEAVLLRGDGSLYWAPGMRAALERAYAGDYDFYLWLNDDTTLDADALSVLLSTDRWLTERNYAPAIVVGSTRDPTTGMLTYGGRYRPSRLRASRFQALESSDEPRPSETMNGNVVLVPRAVARRIGNLAGYRHSFGDQDYGLRARAAGFGVWLAPGTVATCARNPEPVYGERGLLQDLRSIWSIKGLLPADWLMFSRRWHGAFWPLYWSSPYIRRGLRVLGAHGHRGGSSPRSSQ